jgi:hypothetical protein
MRRTLVRVLAAVTLATLVMSGVPIGPTPQPAAAALVATGVNDSLTMKHDRTAVVPAPGVLGNDLNLLGGTTAILVSGVSNGTLSLQSDGGYTYSPSAGYVGSDSFRYHPSGLLYTTATVTITITNATPVARSDAYSSPADTTLVVGAPGVLANDTDADGDALVTERVGGITGSLDLDPDGGFTYTPGGGFSGTATFSYRVWDGVVWSATTTVALTIVAPTPSPSPTPSPTPTPTPAPTSTPTPTPTPTLPLPSIPLPTPTLPLPSIPLPTPTPPLPSIPLPTPTPPLPSIGLPNSPSPTPTGSPAGSATPRPSSSQAVTDPASGGADTGSGRTPPRSGAEDPSVLAPDRTSGSRSGVLVDAPALDLGLGLGVLAGVEVWAVPAAVIGGPGLLVLLWLALQAAGAMAWIPAARRLRDGDVSRARRRR